MLIDYNKHKALKRKYEQQLDAWYKDVALEWKSDHSKVVHTARYFYHCLEGPLMDGPSAVRCIGRLTFIRIYIISNY
jgi:hypothetical protein